MIHTSAEYKSRAAAADAVRHFLANFPTAGYGSSYKAWPVDPFDPIDGYWVVEFTRAASCD